MKKSFIITGAATVLLAGCCCSREYYNGSVNYTQRGPDCVYTYNQDGGQFIDNIRTVRTQTEAKTVVYRDTSCARVFENDVAGRRTVEPRPGVQLIESAPTRQVVRHEFAEDYAYSFKKVQTAPVSARKIVVVNY